MLLLQNAVNTYRMGASVVEEARALMLRYAGAPKNWMSSTPRFHYRWVCEAVAANQGSAHIPFVLPVIHLRLISDLVWLA